MFAAVREDGIVTSSVVTVVVTVVFAVVFTVVLSVVFSVVFSVTGFSLVCVFCVVTAVSSLFVVVSPAVSGGVVDSAFSVVAEGGAVVTSAVVVAESVSVAETVVLCVVVESVSLFSVSAESQAVHNISAATVNNVIILFFILFPSFKKIGGIPSFVIINESISKCQYFIRFLRLNSILLHSFR